MPGAYVWHSWTFLIHPAALKWGRDRVVPLEQTQCHPPTSLQHIWTTHSNACQARKRPVWSYQRQRHYDLPNEDRQERFGKRCLISSLTNWNWLREDEAKLWGQPPPVVCGSFGSSEKKKVVGEEFLGWLKMFTCLLRRWKYCAEVVGLTTCQLTSSPSAPSDSLESVIWRNRSIRQEECSGPAPSMPWGKSKVKDDWRPHLDSPGRKKCLSSSLDWIQE